MPHDPNFGWSDLAKRRAFEERHKSAPIRPMNDVRTCEIVQGASLKHWLITAALLAGGIVAAMWWGGWLHG